RRATTVGPPPAGWFFAAASVVYVLAVSATRYNIAPFGSLYLAPMLPLLFAAVGVALADLERRHRGSRAAVAALLGVTLLGGGLGLWHRLDFRWPGASFTMPGYSYGHLANSIDLRHPHD